MTGAEMIAAERERQVTEEGWTPQHDDEHRNGELAMAAACYAAEAGMRPTHSHMRVAPVASGWPWEQHWWKPTGDPVRDLVKAGALIAAEIDRLLRAGLTEGEANDG